MHCERRQNRSQDLGLALELQLCSTAERASFGSLVLAEERGLMVAGAGKNDELEEIAALAPLLAGTSRFWQGRVDTTMGNRLITVVRVETALGTFYLSGTDGNIISIWSEMRHSSRGVARIVS